MGFAPPEPLDGRHSVDAFDCGEPALDEWLARYARAAQASGSARVYVTTTDGTLVAGFYALAAAQVEPAEATERSRQGEPVGRPVPAILLARLAVDRSHQGTGLGTSLLQDAMLRCLQAADAVGLRVLLVHAKSSAARAWYERFGFEASPTDQLHLMLLVKDLRAFVRARSTSER